MAQPASPARRRRPATRSGGGAGALAATPPGGGGDQSRARSFLVRLGSTVVLIGTFAGIIYLGHVPLAVMILGIQILMVRELYALADTSPIFGSATASPPPAPTRALRWYLFAVAAFWIYTRFCRRQLAVEAVALGGGGGSSGVARLLGWLVRRHNLTAFMLYTAGLVAFVLGLDRGRTLAPFRSFAWAHLTLLFLVLPSSFFVSNLFEGGIIWFLLPASLVIVNDIAAYVAGFFCGRTPLIAVSPKKTWEGFLGGAVGTVGASWVLADFMSRPPWLTCPRTDLSFLSPLACDPGPVYAPRLYALADALPAGALEGDFGAGVAAAAARLAALTFTARPMQLHAVALAAFASLLAPFGGFFASGLKRAFKVKDFGDSIPGHGGMTDRMDCQIVMAVFSSLYLHAFVFPGWGGGGGGAGSSVAALAAAAAALGGRDQLALLAALARGVAGAGLLGGEGAGALEAVAAAAAAAAEGGGDLVAAGDE